MGTTYTRKQGDTADHLVYRLVGSDNLGVNLLGATIRMARHGKPIVPAVAVNPSAPEGHPDRGKVTVDADDITDEAGKWAFDTWVDYAGGDRQKFPREDSDLLVILPGAITNPVAP